MTTPHAIRSRAELRRSRRRRIAFGRAGLLGSGGAMLLLGILSVPTPVPIGFIFFAMGLYLIARGSKRARRSVKHLRRRVPLFSRGLNRAKHRMPPRLRSFIERSDPDE